MDNLIILRRTAFGDIIHTLPVVTHIKRHFPQAHITWMSEVGYAPLLRTVEGIDEVIEVGFRSMMRSKRLREYWRTLRELSRRSFDALLDLQGTTKSWLLIARTKAARKIGFNRADAREPFVTRFYTEQAPSSPEGLHVIRKNLALLAAIGIEAEEIEFPRFRIAAEVEEGIARRLEPHGLAEGFVAVNPFAAWSTKRWPAEHVAALCRILWRELKLRSVILHGPGEMEAASEIASQAGEAAVPAPKTDLLQLVALLKRASAYVGGDTGPTQLAAALGVPLVAIFGPTDPQRNGPVNPADSVIRADLGCEKCKRGRCDVSGKEWGECMRRITPQMVYESLRLRLEHKTHGNNG